MDVDKRNLILFNVSENNNSSKIFNFLETCTFYFSTF